MNPKSLYKITPKAHSDIHDWVVSDKSESETLEWYADYASELAERFNIQKIEGKELEEFYIFDTDTIYPVEEFPELHENEEVTDGGYKITHRGAEVLTKESSDIFIAATSEY